NLSNQYAEGVAVGSSFAKFPKVLFSLTKLERIDLGGCFIKKLPKEIQRLKNLRYLNLFDCRTYDIPEKIASLKKLEQLDLGYYPVGPRARPLRLPESICQLKQLKYLGLSSRGLSLQKVKKLKKCLPKTKIIF
ncbi:MAG: hypothetical protein AAF518_28345, partial [Spirochaetota bacterium]